MLPSKNGAERRRVARVVNYLNRQDDFFSLREWTSTSGGLTATLWTRGAILKGHKTNRERFNLAYWLLGNGLRPGLVEDWVFIQDVRDGHIIQGEYDTTARNQVRTLITRSENGTLFTGLKRVWDLKLGMPVMM